MIGNAAHDQPAVYEEGRDDDHPEADALVNVQLICGLVCHAGDALSYALRTVRHVSHPMHAHAAPLIKLSLPRRLAFHEAMRPSDGR